MEMDMILHDISQRPEAYQHPRIWEVDLKTAWVLCISPGADPAPGWEKEEEEEW